MSCRLCLILVHTCVWIPVHRIYPVGVGQVKAFGWRTTLLEGDESVELSNTHSKNSSSESETNEGWRNIVLEGDEWSKALIFCGALDAVPGSNPPKGLLYSTFYTKELQFRNSYNVCTYINRLCLKLLLFSFVLCLFVTSALTNLAALLALYGQGYNLVIGGWFRAWLV